MKSTSPFSQLDIIVADDHPMTLLGTETYLKMLGCRIIGSYNNGISALNGIVSMRPHIAVLDISMPGFNGLEILERLKQHPHQTKVVLLTMHNDISVFSKANDLGAWGYLLKENLSEEVETCFEKLLKGERYFSKQLTNKAHVYTNNPEVLNWERLTRTEKKIIELVAQQMTNKEIGEFLFISERTVEKHKRNMCEKLELPKGKNMLLVWAINARNLGLK